MSSRKIIRGKIDVTKIDKDALYQGRKGRYLDFALIETPDGKYGDWMITQDLPKDRREAGEKGAILGNATNWEKGGGGRANGSAPADDDDSPF